MWLYQQNQLLILVRLSLLVLISAKIEEDYYLATVLFFTDIHGRVLIVSGSLPAETIKAVTADLQRRLPLRSNPRIKVVPSFENISDILHHDDVVEYLKKQASVQRIDLSLVQSRRIVENLVKRRLSQHVLQDEKKVTVEHEKYTYENHENDPDGREFWHIYIMSTKMTPWKVKNYATAKPVAPPPQIMDSARFFIPSEIYYNVEKRCANWADECKLELGSILNLPVGYIKIPAIEHRAPPTVRWVPREKKNKRT